MNTMIVSENGFMREVEGIDVSENDGTVIVRFYSNSSGGSSGFRGTEDEMIALFKRMLKECKGLEAATILAVISGEE